MKDRLVLVADQTVARIFSSKGVTPTLTLLKEMTNEVGRLKEQDLVTDGNGSMFDALGPNKSGYEPKHSQKEIKIIRFLKGVVASLKEITHNESFELTVIAAPKILGWVRPSIQEIKTISVIAEIQKDLSEKDPSEIAEYVGKEV